VRFSPRERIAVISTPGVIHLLGDSESNLVSGEELARIRRAIARGYKLSSHAWVNLGTHVRVRGGVFDGVMGVVTELRQQCRVILELAAIRQCFSLEVGIDEVERVEAAGHPAKASRFIPVARSEFEWSVPKNKSGARTLS
jgi:transcription antitermination factor NusG